MEQQSTATVQEQTPRSVFIPQTTFYDSGLGSSIATGSLKVYSTASHSSFASNIDDSDSGTFRVPPTPPAVFDGVPFKCKFCQRMVGHLRNRNHWKMHVFADLNAYICTSSDCSEQLTTFQSREQWAQHEFSKHRSLRVWSCPECDVKTSSANAMKMHLLDNHGQIIKKSQISNVLNTIMSIEPASIDDQSCPLCLLVPGVSRRNFTNHVARHLESIALAVIPRDADDNTDADSASDDCSARFSARSLPWIGSKEYKDL